MKRYCLQEPVTVHYWDRGVREAAATVKNGSPDGLYLETEAEIPTDRQLEVSFTLPATLRSAGVRFVCRCRVVRAERIGKQNQIAAVILRSEGERMGTAPETAKALPCPGLVMAD
jgi:hypothetical protein